MTKIKYSICFATISPESVEFGEYADSGFIEKNIEGTLSDFLYDVKKYGCFYTSNSDGSGWLHSDWDYEGKDSFETGEQTSYSIHINSKITDSSLKRVNRIAINQ